MMGVCLSWFMTRCLLTSEGGKDNQWALYQHFYLYLCCPRLIAYLGSTALTKSVLLLVWVSNLPLIQVKVSFWRCPLFRGKKPSFCGTVPVWESDLELGIALIGAWKTFLFNCWQIKWYRIIRCLLFCEYYFNKYLKIVIQSLSMHATEGHL